MSRSTLLSSAATSFSHLVGRGPKSGTRAEDDRKDEDRDEDKSKKGKSKAEEDGDDKEKDKDRDEDKSKASDDEDKDEKDDDDRKSKASDEEEDADDDKDEDEDEDDERDKKDAKASAARTRERARCAAIFASQHAAGRVAFAAHLAFNTKIGRRAAVAMLKATPKTAEGGGLSGRMTGMEQLRPGADAPRPTERQARQSGWDQAATRIGVKPR